MTFIRFLKSNGSLEREVDVPQGANLLDVAQDAGQPLEGTCEKQMSCSTCHVILADEDYERLPPPSEDEEYLLDIAIDARRTSRLACQITVAGERLTVQMP